MNSALILKEKEEKRFSWGHDWVFSNEIDRKTGDPKPGAAVELHTSSGEFLGIGFYNPASLIVFRALARKKVPIDKDFLKRRLNAAILLRRKNFSEVESYRAVFAESDGLPGLIIDKYGDYLSCEFNCLGIAGFRQEIVDILAELLKPKGIFERTDSGFRVQEGITGDGGVLLGEVPEQTEIVENGLKYIVNLHSGQKTGFFFDQRGNRRKIREISAGKRVLDCYSHTGGFALNALQGGAVSAVCVDSSGPAVAIGRQNAVLNGLGEKALFHEADAYEFLLSAKQKKEKFDIINLDPPALIKGKKSFEPGFKHYIKINQAAIEMLAEGGILASSSCSGNLGIKDFHEVLRVAAGKAMKRVRLIHSAMQDLDHPVLVNMPETRYLKFALLEII